MQSDEFVRVLELFPVVRPRDFHFDSDASTHSSSHIDRDIQPQGHHDAFWNKLKAAAEQKVGATDADRFCKAFKQVYEKLVYEELSLDAAQSLMNLTIS